MILLDHKKECEIWVFDGFLVGKFEFFLRACRKGLNGSIEIRLSLLIFFKVYVFKSKNIVNPESRPETLLDSLSEINGLIHLIKLKKQNKDQSVCVIMGLVKNKSLFKVSKCLLIFPKIEKVESHCLKIGKRSINQKGLFHFILNHIIISKYLHDCYFPQTISF